MTLHQLIDRWRARREQYREDGALVVGEKIATLIVSELETVLSNEGQAFLTLTQAAAESGFSAGYLGRLVRTGKLPNCGRKNAPLVSAANLPRKPGFLPPANAGATLELPKRRIAASVIHPAS